VSEYVEEIYEYLREKEQDLHLGTKFLSIQEDVTDKMRTILIDWLVEVHRMFKLFPESLFLSIAIVDKYLSLKKISRAQLQLVGITSLLLSAKYEEIYPPDLKDFVYISDQSCTQDQILETEENILASLDFNLSFPSALHFLRRFSKAAGSDQVVHNLCKYLCEIALLDVKLMKFLPSEIAAGSVYLARVMTNHLPLWTPSLEHYSKYTSAHARTIAQDLNDFLKKVQRSNIKNISKKYSSPAYESVASISVVDLF